MQTEEEYNKNRILLYGENDNSFKLTREQKRRIEKQNRFSNRIKSMVNNKTNS